jgi:hypothetical protein
MSWNASSRREYEKAQRLQEREAKKRLRELERRAKEETKLSAVEQARLEVESYEGQLDVLSSIHGECGPVWDWMAYAIALRPHEPSRSSRHQTKAKYQAEFERKPNETAIAQAREHDEQEFQEAQRLHSADIAEWQKMKSLAARILSADHKAYLEALVGFSALAELSELGSSIHFTVHSRYVVECVLSVKGQQVIPKEVKALTSAGKLSVKGMPQTRFHEIYQDYVCGCVLRVAREVFAVLPIQAAIVTASAEMTDSRTGHLVDKPVLSVGIHRNLLLGLNFENIDPSDAIENFVHRGDAKTSRKSGAFTSIEPLKPEDLGAVDSQAVTFKELFDLVRKLKEELATMLSNAGRKSKPVPF